MVWLQMAECALTMLTALADEVNNMDKARRTELVAATSSQWSDVAGLAIGFIPKQMAAGLLQSSGSTPAQPAEEGTS
jgi:hypothetical protein